MIHQDKKSDKPPESSAPVDEKNDLSSAQNNPAESPAVEKPHEKKQSKPQADETVTLKKAEYEDILAKLQEVNGAKDKMLRTVADFENAKKRLAKERDEYVRFSQERLIREILPVLDNFERALSHASEIQDTAAKGIADGVQMVIKQLAEILKNQGLVRLKTVGEKFDPHQHEAVGYVYEDGEEDKIVEEIEAGYTLHQRLLRAAKVRVRMHAQNKKVAGKEQEEIT